MYKVHVAAAPADQVQLPVQAEICAAIGDSGAVRGTNQQRKTKEGETEKSMKTFGGCSGRSAKRDLQEWWGEVDQETRHCERYQRDTDGVGSASRRGRSTRQLKHHRQLPKVHWHQTHVLLILKKVMKNQQRATL